MLRFVFKLEGRCRFSVGGAIALSLLVSSCSLIETKKAETSAVRLWGNILPSFVSEPDTSSCAIANPLAIATSKAQQAETLSQTARTPQDWDLVVLQWMSAIRAMQSVPIASPQRVFAQKKVAEYQQKLLTAQQKATAKTPLPFASFSSAFLDEQLLLFLSYIAAVGPPDVLIIGSSRAIQGVDVQHLQAELADRGQPNLRIFNFGVNGATAQVVDLVLRELLTPEQLPQLIIWADGVRAFNSGRGDRTYNGIVASTGYQQLKAGDRPFLPASELQFNQDCEQSQALSVIRRSGITLLLQLSAKIAQAAELNAIDANGFLPVSNRFNPITYYQQFPRVAGRYDGDYQNFNLWGEQTVALKRLTAYTQSQQIPLVFVNLPLTQDYLDDARSRFEQEFRTFMQFLSDPPHFIFIDLTLNSALQGNDLFADPSHLNRFGAIAVARQLALQSQIPWPDAPQPPPAPTLPESEDDTLPENQ